MQDLRNEVEPFVVTFSWNELRQFDAGQINFGLWYGSGPVSSRASVAVDMRWGTWRAYAKYLPAKASSWLARVPW